MKSYLCWPSQYEKDLSRAPPPIPSLGTRAKRAREPARIEDFSEPIRPTSTSMNLQFKEICIGVRGLGSDSNDFMGVIERRRRRREE